jgi:hypothetical protein
VVDDGSSDNTFTAAKGSSDPRAYRALAKRYVDLACGAYPSFPKLTDEALRKAQEMGGTGYIPRFGTWKVHL